MTEARYSRLAQKKACKIASEFCKAHNFSLSDELRLVVSIHTMAMELYVDMHSMTKGVEDD